ncbi:MAG: lysine--tRNA ligase [Candidatus Saccharimonadales bacterium]|jgi:lysyl-tRNA synthetase class 1
MQWLNEVVDEIVGRFPEGDILIESGGSPSGVHHLGHLRELITSDALMLELQQRGRQTRHIYYADDLDGLRKIPVNVPANFEKYLGRPLCDIPSPDGSSSSYADHFLQGLIDTAKALGMEIEFIHSSKKYRAGFFTEAIEKALDNIEPIHQALENISGHKLGDEWSPIQINEGGYLKKRRFVSIDKASKTVAYEDLSGQQQSISYSSGDVKLDWRIDWPARWWLLKVNVEPFGRDHATKGGSYDTGAAIIKDVYGADPPLAVPYDFVNLAGDSKKMSASKGTGLDAEGVVKVLPPEIVRFFMLRYPPSKRLYFDPENGVSQLIDDFAALLAKKDKTKDEQQLVDICNHGINPTVSTIPFSHLTASYQASLKDPVKTIDFLRRTEPDGISGPEQEIIKDQLIFIDQWLEKWAPDDVKFELAEKVDADKFNDAEKSLLSSLADKIASAPADADGEWFHKAIYDLKESGGLTPEQVFEPLYRALIGKDSGPRAGWFLSILPRDWLAKRLKLEA